MNVSIVTAFPGFFRDFLSESMIGRAVRNGLIRIDVVDLRDFGSGNYRQVDDYSFKRPFIPLRRRKDRPTWSVRRPRANSCPRK